MPDILRGQFLISTTESVCHGAASREDQLQGGHGDPPQGAEARGSHGGPARPVPGLPGVSGWAEEGQRGGDQEGSVLLQGRNAGQRDQEGLHQGSADLLFTNAQGDRTGDQGFSRGQDRSCSSHGRGARAVRPGAALRQRVPGDGHGGEDAGIATERSRRFRLRRRRPGADEAGAEPGEREQRQGRSRGDEGDGEGAGSSAGRSAGDRRHGPAVSSEQERRGEPASADRLRAHKEGEGTGDSALLAQGRMSFQSVTFIYVNMIPSLTRARSSAR
jgi:hypothetical protein